MPVRPLLVAFAALSVALVVVSETPSQAGQPAATCFGRTPTIRGTFGNDTITGTSGPDVILARSGNDTVHGMGGADFICGNEGRDTLNGNGGNDRISGGPRDDTINGGFNNDTIQGNDANDTLNGNSGDDNINGGAGTDACDGGTGTNSISNCEGGDSVVPQAVEIFSGVTFDRPIDFDPIPGLPGSYVVTQQAGTILRIDNGVPSELGDLSAIVTDPDVANEAGLLSFAFPPDFSEPDESRDNVYVYYTTGSPIEGRLAEFDIDDLDDPPIANVRLAIPDIANPTNTNHNGGGMAFGVDGYLYLSIGDGGGSNDPEGNGQDLEVLAGKVLRLDVENVDGDGDPIPDTNPFVDVAGRDEIWAYGLRNPWRFSFDPATSVLWLADVGQASREEVNTIEAGQNYGWDCREGFQAGAGPGPTPCGGQFQDPEFDYSSADASGRCSVTGGVVYRGPAIPGLVGDYVFGDLCTGEILFTPVGSPSFNPSNLIDTVSGPLVSFSVDHNGEIIVVTFNELYRIVPAP